MRLHLNTPWRSATKVFIDGIEQKHCFAADDQHGLAICAVLSATGNVIPEQLHRDWKPGEMPLEAAGGIVVHLVIGRVVFRFDSPEIQADAEARWQDFEKAFSWVA